MLPNHSWCDKSETVLQWCQPSKEHRLLYDLFWYLILILWWFWLSSLSLFALGSTRLLWFELPWTVTLPVFRCRDIYDTFSHLAFGSNLSYPIDSEGAWEGASKSERRHFLGSQSELLSLFQSHLRTFIDYSIVYCHPSITCSSERVLNHPDLK